MSDERVDVHNPATELGEKVAATSDPDASVEAMLDAVTLRTRSEFDANLAKAMHSVLGEAIRMVEAGTIRADKATPGVSSLPTFANHLLDTHHHVYWHRDPADLSWIQHPPNQRVLFSENLIPSGPEEEGPSYRVVQLDVGQEGSDVQPTANEKEGGTAATETVSAARIFIAGGLPVGITTAGILLAIGSAVTEPIKPNPYVAITVLVLGLGLILTALAALRERRQGPS